MNLDIFQKYNLRTEQVGDELHVYTRKPVDPSDWYKLEEEGWFKLNARHYMCKSRHKKPVHEVELKVEPEPPPKTPNSTPDSN